MFSLAEKGKRTQDALSYNTLTTMLTSHHKALRPHWRNHWQLYSRLVGIFCRSLRSTTGAMAERRSCGTPTRRTGRSAKVRRMG